MAYFYSLSFKYKFSFFLYKMPTGEVATNIEDINKIIVLISALYFSLPIKELVIFIKISINIY